MSEPRLVEVRVTGIGLKALRGVGYVDHRDARAWVGELHEFLFVRWRTTERKPARPSDWTRWHLAVFDLQEDGRIKLACGLSVSADAELRRARCRGGFGAHLTDYYEVAAAAGREHVPAIEAQAIADAIEVASVPVCRGCLATRVTFQAEAY